MALSKRFPHLLWLRRVESPLVGWLWSLAFLGAMFALRYELTFRLGSQFPFFTFTLAVILSSLFAGWRSATVVLFAGYFLGEYYFLKGGLFPKGLVSWFGAIFYFFTNGVIIAYSEAAYTGLARSQETAQELAHSAERFRLATEAMQGMVYEWELSSDHVERSTGLKSLLGYEEGEDEPTAQWWQAQIHPDDLPRIERLDAEIARRAKSIYEIDYRVKNKQGEYLWVSDKCLIQRDKEQTITKVIGCTVDITERVKAEQALKSRTTQVEQLNVRLQSAMNEAHHRINNNLQVIVSLADIALVDSAGAIPRKEMERVGQHARALAAVNEILTQNAAVNAEMDTVTTGEIRDKLIPLIQSTLGTRPIHYEIEEIVLPAFHGSSLAMLICELIGNSVKHGAGTITVTLTRSPQSKQDAPKSLVLTVEDEGKGFPAEFDPRRITTTGWGLSKSLAVHDLQGKLEFFNSGAGGACVSVVFPMPVLPAEPTEQTGDSTVPEVDKFPSPTP